MEASYGLITDNLMDLSHTAVVHEGILGSEHTVKANLSIEQKGTTVKVGRSVPNVPAPGLYDLIYKNDGRQVDLWMDMRRRSRTSCGDRRSRSTQFCWRSTSGRSDIRKCWIHLSSKNRKPLRLHTRVALRSL
jgi:phenylpropionate dioxygenase-like ring-hydroxylating dioxygenase large terminal subunit